MNSITFVVDKLTPPSTQLRHPHASNTSSPTSSSRPDSGYFSIYSSDNDETDLMTRADPLLRRRKVESDAGPTEVFREKFPVPDRNARSSNIVLRGLKSLLTTLTGILWALIYPFARGYSSLKRLISRYPRHITSTHHSDPNLLHSMPPAFPAISATEGVPFRPPSSASSASEASSSGTDSDAETDISTLAPTDISEVSSMSSAPSLRRSPRLHSVSEKEELMALSRRRTADSLKSPTSPRTPSITSKTPHTSLPITTAKTAVQLIPRPLIPTKPSQKTLVLDLDETLIHSLAKGGKLGSGHMVEVKFDRVPILYFVHKRPYCDLFLRKVLIYKTLSDIGVEMVRRSHIHGFGPRIRRPSYRLARSRAQNFQGPLL